MAPSTSTVRRTRTAAFVAATAIAATAFGALPAAADERHRVTDGDTVSALAVRYGTSARSIIDANDLGARALIVIGQSLTIPTGGSGSATAASGTHTVAAGDTVWDLARRYGTTVSALIDANGLDSRAIIREGQSLIVPGGSTATPAANTSTPSDGVRHTVAEGDTVWGLARKFGTSVSDIVRANDLDSRAIIREGQTLTIPGATAVGDTPASTAVATDTNLAEFGGATQQHTVASGDTLARIADRFGVTVSAIVSANAIKNPSVIRTGQQLTIPGGVPSGLVGDTFLGRTYSAGVVGAANQNKATLNATDVPSRAQMQQMIADTARSMGVDPALAQAVAYQESGFNMRAVSPANAVGAMQVIPSTGEWASDLVGRDLDLLNPQDNVTAGVAVLRHLQRDGRELETAIAGYYQGETGVRKYGMYADTKRYVASVLALTGRFS
ncbi:LysM peptidoglycan-binding domain-containing protein [Demequina sp. SO4-13]|uniref:LysM peptidoglycan-binding domain-containing protein n=1 Tax=Demequina sp. SO4-13 TaxID=3401027 RepID=UPI003AF67E5B